MEGAHNGLGDKSSGNVRAGNGRRRQAAGPEVPRSTWTIPDGDDHAAYSREKVQLNGIRSGR